MNIRSSLVTLTMLLAAACNTVGVSRELGGFAVVRPAIAYAMILDTRQLVVLDFRTREEFDGGHVAGALSTPLGSIENRIAELLPYQSSTILTYASSEEEGIRAATLLVAAGFRNVIRIKGGIGAWIEGGYPTVTSP
ncbi:MAG TPA: rhodanese-like domain-containing protein [Thermoanaerobaculia bacterium]|nr:rhodanese-like domain-containing protein [Thermoanaerobaculia bacterium]